MRYIVTGSSDIGISKKVNQDAVSVKVADTFYGEVVLAVLCDGMGGYEQGEVASASVIQAFNRWFLDVFLQSMEYMDEMRIFSDMGNIVSNINNRIYQYGLGEGIVIGTTLTALLIFMDKYYIVNVGDSRAYELGESICRITRDHSFVEEEILKGRMTREEARLDKRKNRLTRCIGCTPQVKPDFYSGITRTNAIYMLCSDGVRNKVDDNELFYFLHPSCLTDEDVMENNTRYIYELNKMRYENDNMSIVLVRAVDTGETDILCNSGPVIKREIVQMESDKYISAKE